MFCINFLLDFGYVLFNNKDCDIYGPLYDNLDLAEEECSHTSGCGGVWDGDCDNDRFSLCSIGTFEDTSSNRCVYDKRGNSHL